MRLPSPKQALLLSITAAILTIALKAGAWLLTGSVGFLSDALESLVNLAGAGFALWMVSYAQQPPDEDHPYGHGKAEYFSAAFEGGLIFIAALSILFAAGERLFNPQPLGSLGIGTLLSVLATAINFFVARVLFQVARAHHSLALEADARHLMADVWTTVGVVAGVAVAGATGWVWLDPVIAGLVALNILREGGHLLSRSFDGLMDHALPPADVQLIETTLRDTLEEGCSYARLRTRQSGANRFAVVNLLVPGDWSVARAHVLADRLEDAVEAATRTRLTTHVEPND